MRIGALKNSDMTLKFSCFFFFLCRNSQAYPKIHIEMKGTESGQNYLEKKKLEDSYFPISKLNTKLQ